MAGCRKGNRECVYPQPSTSSKSRSKAKSKASSQQDSGSSEEEQEQNASDAPTFNADADSTTANEPTDVSRRGSLATASHSHREVSDTSSLDPDDERSPSTETPSAVSGSQPQPGPASGFSQPGLDVGRSHLPPDIVFYLDYHRKYISYRHYRWKDDPAGFLGSTFLEIAVRNEPLMYAVVGFAAYQHALTNQHRRMQEFLAYHHKAVSLLRLSLQENREHTVALLLTILQLATTEVYSCAFVAPMLRVADRNQEYLGDQINLLGHQKAACEILIELYTPQTIRQNATSQAILKWYVHFAGSLPGTGTMLSSDWFESTPPNLQQVGLEQIR